MAVNDLNGRQVLVTGAGSGIGRATALEFARAGASLIISDLQAASLAETEKAVAALGRPCLAFTADVGSEDSMRELARRVHECIPALDVLVNNAGIGYMGPFTATPLAAWRKILDINVMGIVHGCHFFLPRMLEAGGSRQVVNVASLAGIAPVPGMSAYATSKYAALGLSEVLMMELASTCVGVTAVCPGVINTPIVNGPTAEVVSREQVAGLQAFYRASGCGPEVVARGIVDAVRSGRELLLVGPFAKPMYHVKRVSRSLARRLSLDNAVKSGFWIPGKA